MTTQTQSGSQSVSESASNTTSGGVTTSPNQDGNVLSATLGGTNTMDGNASSSVADIAAGMGNPEVASSFTPEQAEQRVQALETISTSAPAGSTYSNPEMGESADAAGVDDILRVGVGTSMAVGNFRSMPAQMVQRAAASGDKGLTASVADKFVKGYNTTDGAGGWYQAKEEAAREKAFKSAYKDELSKAGGEASEKVTKAAETRAAEAMRHGSPLNVHERAVMSNGKVGNILHPSHSSVGATEQTRLAMDKTINRSVEKGAAREARRQAIKSGVTNAARQTLDKGVSSAIKSGAHSAGTKAIEHVAAGTLSRTGARAAAGVAGRALVGGAAKVLLGAVTFPIGTFITVATLLMDPMIAGAMRSGIEKVFSDSSTPSLEAEPSPPRTQYLPLCNDGNRDPAIEAQDGKFVKVNNENFGFDPAENWHPTSPAVEETPTFDQYFQDIADLSDLIAAAANDTISVLKKYSDEKYVGLLRETRTPFVGAISDMVTNYMDPISQKSVDPVLAYSQAWAAFRQANYASRHDITTSNDSDPYIDWLGGLIAVDITMGLTANKMDASDFAQDPEKMLIDSATAMENAKQALDQAGSDWRYPELKSIYNVTGINEKSATAIANGTLGINPDGSLFQDKDKNGIDDKKQKQQERENNEGAPDLKGAPSGIGRLRDRGTLTGSTPGGGGGLTPPQTSGSAADTGGIKSPGSSNLTSGLTSTLGTPGSGSGSAATGGIKSPTLSGGAGQTGLSGAKLSTPPNSSLTSKPSSNLSSPSGADKKSSITSALGENGSAATGGIKSPTLSDKGSAAGGNATKSNITSPKSSNLTGSKGVTTPGTDTSSAKPGTSGIADLNKTSTLGGKSEDTKSKLEESKNSAITGATSSNLSTPGSTSTSGAKSPSLSTPSSSASSSEGTHGSNITSPASSILSSGNSALDPSKSTSPLSTSRLNSAVKGTDYKSASSGSPAASTGGTTGAKIGSAPAPSNTGTSGARLSSPSSTGSGGTGTRISAPAGSSGGSNFSGPKASGSVGGGMHGPSGGGSGGSSSHNLSANVGGGDDHEGKGGNGDVDQSDPAANPEGQDGPTREVTTITREGQTYEMGSSKAAKMAELLSPGDGTPGVSLREAAAAAGFKVPPAGFDIGTPISPSEIQPGDVVIGEGIEGIYIGDGLCLTAEGIKPLSEVAIFTGENQGIFRLDGNMQSEDSLATGQASTAEEDLKSTGTAVGGTAKSAAAGTGGVPRTGNLSGKDSSSSTDPYDPKTGSADDNTMSVTGTNGTGSSNQAHATRATGGLKTPTLSKIPTGD